MVEKRWCGWLAVVVVLLGCEGEGRTAPPACPGAGGCPVCDDDLDCPAKQRCGASGSCEARPSGTCGGPRDCDAPATCEANLCVAPVPECDRPENVAVRVALAAAQPAIRVGTGPGHKAALRAVTSFPSAAGDASLRCESGLLEFKDLDGDGALDPYEDWTLPAGARAADLVARLDTAERAALLLHPLLSSDAAVTGTAPGAGNAASVALAARIAAGQRSGTSVQAGSRARARALWANDVQARCEATPLGIPFVPSSAPTHSAGPGRSLSRDLSIWPMELGLGATHDPGHALAMGRVVAAEYRAIGLRLTLGPPANLATDPRWVHAPLTYGEDPGEVSAFVAGFVEGARAGGLATATGDYPGAGAAGGGFDARLSKGKYLRHPGGRFDDHLAPFQAAIAAGTAAVVASHGIPAAGAWSALGGQVDGATIEQVGAAFHRELLTDVLRGALGFEGVVLAPPGVLEDPGLSPLGAPWGLEGATRVERAARALNAGVDQFLGLDDPAPIVQAVASGAVPAARLEEAASRVLVLAFGLGLFEDPYVDPPESLAVSWNSGGLAAGREAAAEAIVAVVNGPKPAGFWDEYLPGGRPSTFNAGNGTGNVLPAPAGLPYPLPTASAYFGGAFDLATIQAFAPFGRLCNEDPVATEALRMAGCDYVFLRVAAPGAVDPDSGPLGHPGSSLEFEAAGLAAIAAARAAIDAAPESVAQLVVVVDGGRPAVLSQIMALRPDALLLTWAGQHDENPDSDRSLLDVLYGYRVRPLTSGRLPVALPASDGAAAAQLEDVPGDGADPALVRGLGREVRGFVFNEP